MMVPQWLHTLRSRTPKRRLRRRRHLGAARRRWLRLEPLEERLPLAADYGDAPDTAAGTGAGNYNTLATDSGPSHVIVAGLRMGAGVDGDDGTLQNAVANADDVDQALPDDEDGLSNPVADLMLTIGAVPTVNVIVTNTTGSTATLSGWIDYNNNGAFDNSTERAQASVVNGTDGGIMTLTFPAVSVGFTGTTYARFRLSTDVAAEDAIGAALDGEIEDYVATITLPSSGEAASTAKIASGTGGGPTLANSDNFGASAASLGDLDGDGVTDLAVGATGDDTGGSSRGAVHVLFMNSNGSVKSAQEIASGVSGGPTLANSDQFGASVASLGDLDGDGVTDLAVGATGDDTGGSSRGAVHVLFMNSNGSVKSAKKIASGVSGGPGLTNFDQFGSSVASLGDLDGDGVTDLAVGARFDDTGATNTGAVYVLLMNTDGTVKSSAKIANATGGGPSLSSQDSFGGSISTPGDLDEDGVTDLVVGAHQDDTGGSDRGAVYVLFMKTDGTASQSIKIASGTGGGPELTASDKFGSSVASLGDLDGDGVTDLAVAAPGDDTGGSSRGAVHVLLMNTDGTVKKLRQIAHETGGGPTLADFDNLGGSLSTLGDLDGDGVADVAVGAKFDDTGGSSRGAVHILFMKAVGPPTVTSIARQDPLTSPTNADQATFRVTFNKDVKNVTAADFALSGTSAGDGTIGTTVQVSSDIYDIPITGVTNSDGIVNLDVATGNDITDLLGIALGDAPTIDSEQEYRFDNTAPNLTSITRQDPAASPTRADTLTFRVVFDEEVTAADVADFAVAGATTATITDVSQITDVSYDVTVSGGDLANFNGTVGLDLGGTQNITDIATNALAQSEPVTDETYAVENLDYGDALDLFSGSATGDYQTRAADNGPSHTLVPGLLMGVSVDGDSGVEQNAAANADDVDQALPDDEDGLNNPAADLILAVTTQPRVNVIVTNTTGSIANLRGWIDYNNDGVFDNAAERAQAVVADGANGEIVTLTFPPVPTGFTGKTYARFRLSTDGAAEHAYGPALDGEVEDYVATITMLGEGSAASTKKIAEGTNGGPTPTDSFGRSVVSLGDLDGDGVTDLAVGAGSSSHSEVYVLFMNSDGTTKSSSKIGNGIGGGPPVAAFDFFGSSLASLGDLDGDGVTELAVGSPQFENSGAVYVLFLNADGTAKDWQIIADRTGGGPFVGTGDDFGASVSSLGDLNGDGVTDLVVGSPGENAFGELDRGALFVLFMNPDGTAQSSQKIGHETGGGPTLPEGSPFGQSLSSLGDLDGDGVTDLAVGASADDTGGTNRGAVYVMFMNPDGTAKSSQKIAHNTGGGPTFLADNDFFGGSVSSLGDLDGDGVADLAVGAHGDDTSSKNDVGRLYVLLMNTNGTVKESQNIGHETGGGPTLADGDRFGFSVASLGDLDGDGVIDLAVGATGDDTGSSESGAVHVLFLDVFADITPPTVTSIALQTPAQSLTNADQVTFRITFDENVQNVTGNDFTLSGTAAGDGTIGAASQVFADVYDIPITGLTNSDGTVNLDFATGNDIQDLWDNALGNSPTIGSEQEFVLDNTAPTVAITRADSDPTNADTVVFNVNFGDAVLDVDAADFVVALTGTATANGTVTVGDAADTDDSTYTIAVNTIAADGTLGLDIAGGTDITDVAANALNQTPTADEIYTIDNTAPTLTSFTRQFPATSPTNADTLIFRATFDQDVNSSDAADFEVTGTTATISNVAMVNGSTYDITVSGGNLAGLNTTVGLNLASGQNISDAASNALPNTEPTTDETYIVDNTEPSTVLIFPADAQLYSATTWTDNVAGTASDAGGAAVDEVEVSIERLSDNKYWSGSAFDSDTEDFQTATGTTSWTLPFADSNLTDGVQYTVRAHATDTAGNEESTAVATFRFGLAAPVTTAPTGTDSDTTPTFTWNAVADADSYELWVYHQNTNTHQIVYEAGLTQTSFTPSSALPEGTYTFWVRAHTSGGESSVWSGGLGFSIGLQPDTPTVTGPTGTTGDTTPTFTWNTAANATSYELSVYNATTQTHNVMYQAGIAATSYTSASALPFGNYQFWVRAHAAGGVMSSWSTTSSFTVGAALTAPTLTSPSGVTGDTTPDFTWDVVAGAASYELSVYSVTTGTHKVLYNPAVATNSYTPTAGEALPGGDYRFWVRASDGTNQGPWSGGMDFTVGAVPTVPTVTSPSGNTFDTTPTFTWTDEGAALYELSVYSSTTNTHNVISQTLAGTSFTPSSAMASGVYQGWVRAQSSDGIWSAWSPTANFSVGVPDVPVVIGPSGNTSDTTPTFSWNAATGATRYELWVYDFTTGTHKVIHDTNITGTSYTSGTALTAGHTYWFWIRAFNSDDLFSAWTGTQTFSII